MMLIDDCPGLGDYFCVLILHAAQKFDEIFRLILVPGRYSTDFKYTYCGSIFKFQMQSV